MRKIFLYLYPIKDYFAYDIPHFYDDNSKLNKSELYIKYKAFRQMNELINKRYREKGFEIYYVMFPNREIYGLEKQVDDKIIYVDYPFDDFDFHYADLSKLYTKIGNIDYLVVGGFHECDCVRKAAEYAYNTLNIDTLVDCDLTNLFFQLRNISFYFDDDQYEQYDQNKFIKFFSKYYGDYEPKEIIEKLNNPVYGLKK